MSPVVRRGELDQDSRYRLCTGLVRFAEPDAYVIEGGPESAAFNGPGAVDVLPELCDLLDGRRSTRELAAALGTPVADVVDGIELLWRHGLVELATSSTPSHGSSPDLLAFCSRSVGYTGRLSSAADAVTNLELGRVLVSGRGELADAMRAELATAGLNVDDYSPARLREMAVVRTDNDVQPSAVVLQILERGTATSTRPSFVEAESLRECLDLGSTWLGAGSAGNSGFVGPLAHRDYSCPACTWSFVSSWLDEAPGSPSPSGLLDLVVGLAVAEVVNAVTGIAGVGALNQSMDVTWDRNRRSVVVGERRRLYRALDCGGCADPLAANGFQVSWRYEQEVEDLPPQYSMPARIRRVSDTRSLQDARRSLPTCPSVPLEALAAQDTAMGRIGVLLRSTVGSRDLAGDGTVRRMTPSGGNLASPQAFLVSRSEIEGLQSHAAWYDDRADRLVATGRVTGREIATALGDLLPGEEWGWLVVWVADVGKVATKYRDFAVRLVHLDAGVAITHALMVAPAVGLSPRLLASWDAGPFVNLLDLDPEAELVTSVMVL